MLKVSKDKFRKALVAIAIIILTALALTVLVNADPVEEYVIDVVDPKEVIEVNDQEISNDGNISVRKEIARVHNYVPYYDAQELKYKVTVKNISANITPEIALIVDTSHSVVANGAGTQLKNSAKSLTADIYANCKNAKIQLFNAEQSVTDKLAKGSSGTMANAITNLAMGTGSDISTAINLAKNSFTAGNNISKYIIIFTDATDNTKTILQQAQTSGIRVIAIASEDIMSNSYVDNGTELFGRVQMIYSANYNEANKVYDDFDTEEICNIINNCVVDIRVRDVFTEEFVRYFDFELLSTEEEDNDRFERQSDGYVWVIDKLAFQDSKTLEFKLSIKQNAFVEDRTQLYRNIFSSESITTTYKKVRYENKTPLEQTPFVVAKNETPIIRLCNKYSVTFRAVNEEDHSCGIDGIILNIKAVDEDNNVVFDGPVETDAHGNVTIDSLTTTGKISFTIRPQTNVNKPGYKVSGKFEIAIRNRNGQEFYLDEECQDDWEELTTINNLKRDVKITLPINTRRFEMEVVLCQENSENVKISDTNFRLLSPKSTNHEEYVTEIGGTNGDGRLSFSPSVITSEDNQGESLDYILSQLDSQDGFISMGDASIKITFLANGNISNVEARHNDRVSAQRVSNDKVLVKVLNETEEDDTFGVQVNLSDKNNEGIKLQGATYNIKVARTKDDKRIETEYNGYITDEHGNVNLQVPGTGIIELTVQQTGAKVGYELDTAYKTIVLERTNGYVSAIKSAIGEDGVRLSPEIISNSVLIPLYNEKQSERNMMRVQLVDPEMLDEETNDDVPISDVEFDIIDRTTGAVYSGRTNQDGFIEVQIVKESSAGVHEFEIQAKSSLPLGYKDLETAKLTVEYDDKGLIYDVADNWPDYFESQQGEDPILRIDDPEILSNGKNADYTATVVLAATAKADQMYKFKIQLTAQDTGRALEGGVYDIKMVTEAGIERNVVARATNGSGIIQTNLLLDDEVTIYVTQKESPKKYKRDVAVKEIVIYYDRLRGELRLQNQADPEVVFDASSRTITFKHKNAVKTGDDVFLNFTVSKIYEDNSNATNLPLHIYQLDGDATIYTKNTTIGSGTKINLTGETDTSPANMLPDDADPLNVCIATDSNGTVAIEGLRVKGIPVEGEGEARLIVQEMDNRNPNQLKPKADSVVLYDIMYRYDVETQEVELTNVEITRGIRLVKEGSRQFSGVDTSDGYVSNIGTILYSNVEYTGNLELDLIEQDSNRALLAGGSYDIQIIQPNNIGNRVYKNVKINNSKMVLPSLISNVGTEIVIKQVEAPIGYKKDTNTLTLRVSQIQEDGGVVLTMYPTETGIHKYTLTRDAVDSITAESAITKYTLVITDKEQQTFKLRLNVIDKDTGLRVKDYSFNVVSKTLTNVLYNASSAPSSASGVAEVTIGPNYKSDRGDVYYHITKLAVADYYKPIEEIVFKARFNDERKLQGVVATGDFQTADEYYGENWEVAAINQNYADASLNVYVQKQEPLNVEVETVDIITGEKISEVGYKIGDFASTEDVNTKIANLHVYYPNPNKEITYTIENTAITEYDHIPDQKLVVKYDANGDVDTGIGNTYADSDNLEILSIDGRTIRVRIKANPRLKVKITTIDSVTGNIIKTENEETEVKYTIVAPDDYTTTEMTDMWHANGFIQPGVSQVEYKITQSNMPDNYEPEFEKTLIVSYKSTGGIDSVTSSDSNIEITSYEGNEITLTIYNDPRQGIQIENIDYYTGDHIYGGVFNIIPADNEKTTEKDLVIKENGFGSILGSKIPKATGAGDNKARYRVIQTAANPEYAKLLEFEIEVTYDTNRNITDVTVLNNAHSKWLEASFIESTNPAVEGYNGNDKGIVKLLVKSNYSFRINITNLDRMDNRTIAETEYYVNSTLIPMTEGTAKLNSNGYGTAYVDRVGENETVTYVVEETSPNPDYQNLESKIHVEVKFDADGYVIRGQNRILVGDRYAEVSDSAGQTIKDKFTINLTITNNPKLRLNIVDVDRLDNSIYIPQAKYAVSSDANENVSNYDQPQTDDNGLAFTRVTGNTEGREIVYRLKETEPNLEYQSLEPDVLLKINYDENGKIRNVSIDETTDDYATFTLVNNPTNSFDEMTVNIRVTSTPKFRFDIRNVDRTDPTKPIYGTEYEITADNNGHNVDEIVTDENGCATDTRIDGVTQGKSVIYTIHEKKSAADYQDLEQDLKVKATFDAQGELVSVEGIEGNKYFTVEKYDTDTMSTYDRLRSNIVITNNPVFVLDIVNTERVTENPLVDTHYEVTKDSDAAVELNKTDANGETLYKAKETVRGGESIYTIHEISPSEDHQAQEQDIKVAVSFDENGRIQPNSWRIVQGNNYAVIVKDENPESTAEDFTLHVNIISNPYIKINVRSVYARSKYEQNGTDDNGQPILVKVGQDYGPITGTEFIAVAGLNGNNNSIVEQLEETTNQATNADGITTFKFAKGLSTKTITYKISETKNMPGFEINHDIMDLIVRYDQEGKIDTEGTACNSNKVANLVAHPDEFSIDLDIISEEIPLFAVNLTAKDIYDSSKPIQGVKYRAYLEDGMGVPDEDYLTPYVTTDESGIGIAQATTAYTDLEKVQRILRLEIDSVPVDYQNLSNTLGGQTLRVAIRVTFTPDEGKVISTEMISPGGLSAYGWMVDNNMLQVAPAGYGVAVHLNLYPVLRVQLHSQDIYTGAELGNPIRLSTSTYPQGRLGYGDVVQQGWIGNHGGYGSIGDYPYGIKYDTQQTGTEYVRFARTETVNEGVRFLYLYEDKEPDGYQKLRRRDPINYYSGKRIAKIQVKYDECGKILEATVVEWNPDTGCGSQKDFIDLIVDHDQNKLEVKVKYHRKTTMDVKYVDAVSQKEMSGIKIYPFNDGNTRYYRFGQVSYEYTDSKGCADWEYWQINEGNGTRYFRISNSYQGNQYNGYYPVGDYIVAVNYDENGLIQSVTAQSTDPQVGSPKLTATFDGTNVSIKVEVKRRFVMQLFCEDKYDSTVDPYAKFNVQAQDYPNERYEGAVTKVEFTVGEMHAGKNRVKYTIKETTQDLEYYELPDINIYVTFDEDGKITKVETDPETEDYIEVLATEVTQTIKTPKSVDLKLRINKVPKFRVDLELADKFYPSLKLQEGRFTLTNSKGEVNAGRIVTDVDGKSMIEIGEVHPEETVTYTLKQENKIEGYKDHTDLELVFTVTFNKSGYIENYQIVDGSNLNLINVTDTSCRGTRVLPLKAYNIPEYVTLGIINRDDLSLEGINDVQYQVFIDDLDDNDEPDGHQDSKTLVTATNVTTDGIAIKAVDDVDYTDGTLRRVKYTIKQLNVPPSYRPIKDAEFIITYNSDGSIKAHEEISNPSGILIEVAKRNNDPYYVNGTPVQIKLTIDNNNSYDLIVRDEHSDFEGYGIEGTKYSVFIKNEDKGPIVTDSDGDAIVKNQRGTGQIRVMVSEIQAGSGYRTDLYNTTEFVITKGEDVYSLEVDPETITSPDKATVTVDEENGIVQVLFKNDSKYEVGLHKYDSSNNQSLEGVKFEISRQKVNGSDQPEESPNNGLLLPSEEDGIVLVNGVATEGENYITTDENGNIRFDLGKTEPNSSYIYTIKEITPESVDEFEGTFYENYKLPRKEEVHVKISFNQFGEMSIISSDGEEVNPVKYDDNKNGLLNLTSNTPYGHFEINLTRRDLIKNQPIEGANYVIKQQRIDENGYAIDPEPIIVGETAYNTDGSGNIRLDFGKTPLDKHYLIIIEERALPNGFDMLNNPVVELIVHFNKWGDLTYEPATNPRARFTNLSGNPYGVQVTIENKTFGNFEVGVQRNDIVTNNPIEGAQYQITRQEVDEEGNLVDGTLEIIGNDSVFETDDLGQFRYDTEEKPKNIKYLITFDEFNTPPAYQPLNSTTTQVLVEFDEFGEMIRISSSSNPETSVTFYDDNGNGIQLNAPKAAKELLPYKIKVVSEDSETGKRINGSVIDVTVDGFDLLNQPVRLLEETLTTGDESTGGTVVEKGAALTTEELKHWGKIKISVDQTSAAPGYDIADSYAQLEAQVSYHDAGNDLRVMTIELIDNGGLQASVDNTNHIITIRLKDDPVGTFDINAYYKFYEENEAGEQELVYEPLQGAQFNVTAQIQSGKRLVDTGLNETSYGTTEDGKITIKVGKTYAGKTVIYTIKPILPEGYKPIDDIQVLVKYDTSGNIKYKEVLTDQNYARAFGENGTKSIGLNVVTDKVLADTPYQVILEVHNKEEGEYNTKLPGTTYEITVEEEFGKTRTWIETSDNNGQIRSIDFTGYGRIKVIYTEIEAAEGYARVEGTHKLEFTRNKSTQKFKFIANDDAFNLNNEDQEVWVYPQNELRKDKFNLMINKVDKLTNTRITGNAAIFKLWLIEKHEVIEETEVEGGITEDGETIEPIVSEVREEIVYTPLLTASTETLGKLTFEKVDMPDEPGTYTYWIEELQAPEGYAVVNGKFLINVTYERAPEGNLIITNVENASDPSIKDFLVVLDSMGTQRIGLNIKNTTSADVVKDNEYSLDITKIDGNTNQAIEAPALFKVTLPDSLNTEVYAESSRTEAGVGKLDYCYIEQGKDYEVRLTHMPIPTLPTELGELQQTLTYVFKEVVAPTGYSVVRDPVELSITFAYDTETETTYIIDVTSSNPEFLRINNWDEDTMPMDPHTPISIDILNGVDANRTFNVIYNANDDDSEVKATNMPENGEKRQGENYYISDLIPEREGYTFKGWAIVQGNEATYQPGGTFAADQDITFYAVWYENLYIRSTEYFITGAVNVDDLIKSNPDQEVLWLPGQTSQYEEGDLYIKGIRPQLGQRYSTPELAGTFLDEFLNNIQTNADDVKIYQPKLVKDSDGNVVLDDEMQATAVLDDNGNRVIDREVDPLEMIPDSIELKKQNYKKIKQYYIKTGMIVEFTKGDEVVQLTLIVRGDLIENSSCLGDGTVEGQDASKITGLSKTKVRKLDPIDLEALDVYVCQVRRYNEGQREIINGYLNGEMEPMGPMPKED